MLVGDRELSMEAAHRLWHALSVRARLPLSIVVSVGVAGAIGVLIVGLEALSLRAAARPPASESLIGLGMMLWFMDGVLRRRTGRIAAAVVTLTTAGIVALFGFVQLVIAVAESRFDWTSLAGNGAMVLALSLVGLPLLRPSARGWFTGRVASPSTR